MNKSTPNTSSGSKSQDTRGRTPSQQDIRESLEADDADESAQVPAANGDSAGSADSARRDTN